MPTFEVDDWVLATLTNATEPLRITLNSRPYILRPNVPTPIPVDAAYTWFGDPRCQMGRARAIRDQDGQMIGSIHSRETEVRRLRQKWGLPFGDERTFLNADGELGVPDITLTSLDGTDEMMTVFQDPLGNGGNYPGSSAPAQSDFDRINKLAEEMRLLQEKIAQQDQPVSPDEPVTEVDAATGLPADEVTRSAPGFILPESEPAPLFGGRLDESP